MLPHYAEGRKLLSLTFNALPRVGPKTDPKIDPANSALRAGSEVNSMAALNGKSMFPCPVCTQAREVRVTKKDKPYLICDPCGVQVFIRGPAGIQEFKRLLEHTSNEGVVARLEQMSRQYRPTCQECGCQFWIKPDLIKTSTFDGSLRGFRCPQKKCGAIVPWEEQR